jgi:hypothetical protein
MKRLIIMESSPELHTQDTKEVYIFRLSNDSRDHKFMFTNKNGQNAVTYFLSSGDENKNPRTDLILNDFKEFSVIPGDERRYHDVILKYSDSSKHNVQIRCYDQEDIGRFVVKLEKYLKKV